MHTLIVGAGVAGLTLAALMRQRGQNPVIIERAADLSHLGYMLGLLPIRARILHGLGLYQQYLEAGVSMRFYRVFNGRGELLNSYDLKPLTDRFGEYQGISRAELVRILLAASGDLPVRMGTTIDSLVQRDQLVDVTLSDGDRSTFDLVVAADGLHSSVREMILKRSEYSYWETGWGGWVFWADPELTEPDTYREHWGAGRFAGFYPVKNRLGVFLGGKLLSTTPPDLREYLRQEFSTMGGPIEPVLNSVEFPERPFRWDFHDCRSSRWRNGRVVLLGDAAAGFLPTAGLGASMAMEAAATLSDELSRVDSRMVEHALTAYEKRCRRRVETAQRTSRQLARVMFVRSHRLAWARDKLVKFYTPEMLAANIAKLMGPIE